jgi:hypothetical protein
MHFFVTNNDYRPISDAHETMQEAAEYAANACINGEVPVAFVIGMESAIFSNDLPAHIILRISAGADLERLP